MLNWNEVKVGKTELRKGENRMLVLAMDLPWIWCKYMLEYKTLHKDHFHDWTICDPWEEITEECEWGKATGDSSHCLWFLSYQGNVVRHDNHNFKTSKDGRRVWKRKEASR